MCQILKIICSDPIFSLPLAKGTFRVSTLTAIEAEAAVAEVDNVFSGDFPTRQNAGKNQIKNGGRIMKNARRQAQYPGERRETSNRASREPRTP